MANLVVRYPSGKSRVHKVQSTVCPTKAEMGTVSDFDSWQDHLAIMTDLPYGAFKRFDDIMNMVEVVVTAKSIISEP